MEATAGLRGHCMADRNVDVRTNVGGGAQPRSLMSAGSGHAVEMKVWSRRGRKGL